MSIGSLWKVPNSGLVSFSDPAVFCGEMLIRNGASCFPWQGAHRTWQLASRPDLFCYWRLCPGSTEKGEESVTKHRNSENTLRINQIRLQMPALQALGGGNLYSYQMNIYLYSYQMNKDQISKTKGKGRNNSGQRGLWRCWLTYKTGQFFQEKGTEIGQKVLNSRRFCVRGFSVRIYQAFGNRAGLLQLSFCWKNASFSNFVMRWLYDLISRMVWQISRNISPKTQLTLRLSTVVQGPLWPRTWLN